MLRRMRINVNFRGEGLPFFSKFKSFNQILNFSSCILDKKKFTMTTSTDPIEEKFFSDYAQVRQLRFDSNGLFDLI